MNNDATDRFEASTSVGLLAALKSGDQDGWTRFVAIYGPQIYTWCRRAGVREEESADLLQQVLRKVWGGMADFEKQPHRGSFRGWLATITRNLVVDHFRQGKGQPDAAGGTAAWERLQQTPAADAVSESIFGQSQTRQLALRALNLIRAEFPDNAVQAFMLTVLEDQSAPTVAAKLGMSPAAVRKAKSRILKRLRDELGEGN